MIIEEIRKRDGRVDNIADSIATVYSTTNIFLVSWPMKRNEVHH